jgi:transcriptional regulator with GAF, ATPase, and Fis domain
MYDPLVVDTFVRVHAQIGAQIAPTTLPRSALNGITNSSQPIHSQGSKRFDEIAASSGEMRTLYELTHALSSARELGDAADILANHLRRLIPFAQSILFWYHSPTDELEVKHATGHLSSVVKGVRIQLGQRLSGWVAANRQTIVNSDPILDLGEVARTAVPRLRSCLSTSVVCDEQLLGVISLYSDLPDAFDEDHRRIIEAVAQQISHTLKRSAEFEGIEPTDLASSTRTTPGVRADWRVVRRP